jgi:uncharacterized protein
MVKEPRAGRVKTRLGRQVGMTVAAWWFRHQARRLLRHLDDPRWALVLAVTPDAEGLNSRFWPSHKPRIPQGRGDLGQRMARCLLAFHGPAILIGADIPGVRRQHIAQAFQSLGHHASVIGPASDGGFWLIGLRNPERTSPGFLGGIAWSQDDTLQNTLPRLPLPLARAAVLSDVDDADDL